MVCRRVMWPVLLVAGALLVLYAQLLADRVPLACGTGVITPACNVPGYLDRALSVLRTSTTMVRSGTTLKVCCQPWARSRLR